MYGKKLRDMLSYGFERWKRLYMEARCRLEAAAAVKIQTCMRGVLARRKVARLRLQRAKREKKRRAALQARCQRVLRAAKAVQRVARGWLYGRRLAQRIRLEEHMSKVIQRFVRRIAAKLAAR